MADSTRTTIKKELNAAKGNLDWSAHHLTRILEMFLEQLNKYVESGIEPPEAYITMGNALEGALNGIQVLNELIETIDKSI